MPAQQIAGVAVDGQGQRGPAISPRPDPAHVGRPAFVRGLGHGRDGLDAGAYANYPLTDPLPGKRMRSMLPRGGQPLS